MLEQMTRADLPHDTVPEARAQMVNLFLVFTYFRQEDVAKISKVPEARTM